MRRSTLQARHRTHHAPHFTHHTVMKIEGVEKLTNEKWLNLFAVTYERNHHRGRWVFASRSESPRWKERHCDAVLIVPLLREEGKPPRLVLIKEFRVPINDYLYGMPA